MMQRGFRIATIHAYVSIDPADDTEGVIAAYQNGMWMPLIGADEERITSLRPLAEDIARKSGRVVKLVRFSVREDIKTISPTGEN